MAHVEQCYIKIFLPAIRLYITYINITTLNIIYAHRHALCKLITYFQMHAHLKGFGSLLVIDSHA